MTRPTLKSATLLVLAALVLTSAGCQGLFGPITPKERITLFNGTCLEGWKLHVDDPDANVGEIWSVRDGVVHCVGKPNGYMRTEKEYKNYRLHLEWRWAAEPTNSGVLLHSSGKDQVWPRCIEAQLKTGNAGDFVLINGTGVTVGGVNMQNADKQFVSVKKQKDSSEAAAGKWNEYDIVCDGGKIRLFVNGVLQNDATDATDTAGWICLQSEGSPIEFRNIYLEPLN